MPHYILNNFSDVDVITYVDADLYFYADPRPLYEELGEQSVLIIGHRFPEHRRDEEKLHGIYNVGYLSFRNDRWGRECLEWWRERCLEWCYDRAEDGKYADQKYLDDWPQRFQGVVVLQHKGANLAPWNITSYEVRTVNSTIWVDSEPLIFYHFHSLKILKSVLFDIGGMYTIIRQNPSIRRDIYIPYLRRQQLLMRQTNLFSLANLRENVLRISKRKLMRSLISSRVMLLWGPIAQEIYLRPLLKPFWEARQFLWNYISIFVSKTQLSNK